jgi:hypothetical protein
MKVTQTHVSIALSVASAIINIALSIMMLIAAVEVFGWMLTVGLWLASLVLAIAAAWLAYDDKAGERITVRIKGSLEAMNTFRKNIADKFKREPRVIATMSDGTVVREGDFVPQI